MTSATAPTSWSPGITLPGGLVVVGGSSPATPTLRATIERAAELLASTYNINVTMRCNSDGASGGAWLQLHERDRIGANADLGICADVVTEKVRRSRAKIREQDPEIAEFYPDAPVGTITVGAHASERALNDPASVLTEGQRYYAGKHDSVETALAWLLANAHVPDISPWDSEGISQFTYRFRERADELDGERVRITCRLGGSRYTYAHRGTCTVTGTGAETVVRVPRPSRHDSDLVDLRTVTSVEVLRGRRYQPVNFDETTRG